MILFQPKQSQTGNLTAKKLLHTVEMSWYFVRLLFNAVIMIANFSFLSPQRETNAMLPLKTQNKSDRLAIAQGQVLFGSVNRKQSNTKVNPSQSSYMKPQSSAILISNFFSSFWLSFFSFWKKHILR